MSRARAIRLTTLAAASLVMSGPVTEAAILDRAGVYVSYWEATLEGEARIDGATPGAPYDLNQAVGLDGEDGIAEFGAWFHPVSRHRLRLSAFDGSFRGSTTIVDPLLGGGDVLPPATPVVPSVDLELYKGFYSYSFVNLDIVNVGGLIGIDYVDAQHRLAATGNEYAAHLAGGVPVVGLNAQVSPAGFFRAYAEASYANWKIGDLDASILDLAIRLEFYIAHAFGLGAGYRDLHLEVEEIGEGRIETDTSGYELFVLFRF